MEGKVWRPRLPGQALGVAVLLPVIAGIWWLNWQDIANSKEGFPVESVAAVVLFSGGFSSILIPLLFARISICGEFVCVRNFFKVSEVKLSDISSVHASHKGIMIRTRAGAKIAGLAVQESNLATAFGWPTRAKEVADDIMRASAASGSTEK